MYICRNYLETTLSGIPSVLYTKMLLQVMIDPASLGDILPCLGYLIVTLNAIDARREGILLATN